MKKYQKIKSNERSLLNFLHVIYSVEPTFGGNSLEIYKYCEEMYKSILNNLTNLYLKIL